MTCPDCGLALSRYDDERVSCKDGHVWTLPEHADQDQPVVVLRRARPDARAARRRIPAWLPGAVLGALACAGVIFDLLH